MVLSCGTNFTGTLYCDKVTTVFFTCKGTFHSTSINREGCETSSAFCCSSPCAYEKARLRYFNLHIKAIKISETHRLRFTWEATAKGRRSLTSFEVDGGGIKCSLASKKNRSHFVAVYVPVNFVPHEKIMCMFPQSPSRARLQRRSDRCLIVDSINHKICISK